MLRNFMVISRYFIFFPDFQKWRIQKFIIGMLCFFTLILGEMRLKRDILVLNNNLTIVVFERKVAFLPRYLIANIVW